MITRQSLAYDFEYYKVCEHSRHSRTCCVPQGRVVARVAAHPCAAYAQVDFATDLSVVVLSEGKSLLDVDCRLPVKVTTGI